MIEGEIWIVWINKGEKVRGYKEEEVRENKGLEIMESQGK